MYNYNSSRESLVVVWCGVVWCGGGDLLICLSAYLKCGRTIQTAHFNYMYVATCILYSIGQDKSIFQGYKCWWFSRIRHVPRTFITSNLISHACMLQKGTISRKLNLKTGIFRENLYPRNNYTRYTV